MICRTPQGSKRTTTAIISFENLSGGKVKKKVVEILEFMMIKMWT